MAPWWWPRSHRLPVSRSPSLPTPAQHSTWSQPMDDTLNERMTGRLDPAWAHADPIGSCVCAASLLMCGATVLLRLASGLWGVQRSHSSLSALRVTAEHSAATAPHWLQPQQTSYVCPCVPLAWSACPCPHPHCMSSSSLALRRCCAFRTVLAAPSARTSFCILLLTFYVNHFIASLLLLLPLASFCHSRLPSSPLCIDLHG